MHFSSAKSKIEGLTAFPMHDKVVFLSLMCLEWRLNIDLFLSGTQETAEAKKTSW